MRLSKKRAIKLHRELWDWLYHHPSKDKEDWPRWKWNGGDISEVSCGCFLCEYVNLHGSCERRACILQWSQPVCYYVGGEFNLWEGAQSPSTRKKYAKLIRDLPEAKR